MKLLLSAALFLLCISNSLSQGPNIEWEYCFGGTGDDVPSAIIETADHGFIVAGVTWSNDGDVSGYHGGICGSPPWPCYDGWVIKIDSIGHLEWQKTLGGTGYDFINSILQTSDSGYIMAGWTTSLDGDLNGVNLLPSPIWIVKLNSVGIIQWQRCYGGSIGEAANSIIQTNDNGYLVTGYTLSNDSDVQGLHSPGYYDVWVIKLDSVGDLQWQKCLGGTDDDLGKVALQSVEGHYIIGATTQSINGDVVGPTPTWSADNYWLINLDTSGTIQYSRAYGGTRIDKLYDIKQIPDSGYILIGYAESTNYDIACPNGDTLGNWWIFVIDTNYSMKYQHCFGGSESDQASSVQQTPDGGFLVAGATHSQDGDVTHSYGVNDCWIMKLDYALNMQWQECYGGSSQEGLATKITLTHDGGLAFSSETLSNNFQVSGHHAGIGNDFWVVKLAQLPNSITEPKLQVKNFIAHLNNKSNLLSIKLSSENSETLNVEIFDLTGQELFQSNLLVHQGVNIFNTDLNHFSDGIYFIRLQGKEGCMVQKVMTE